MEIKMEKIENYLSVRLLMQGKEVGSIIGKKGDNIKSIREQSGARITISDGSTPERIVTINGVVENVNKAFSMICKKFEDDLKQTCNANSIPPITLRLIVPASQCGSIIGKGGSKIKEIRESTGASIQVASEMLPSSTERAVTVSGKLDSIIECFKQVSAIMLESPPKGDTLIYKPKQVASAAASPNSFPIIFANGQVYQVQGQYAIPLPPHEVAKLVQMGALGQTFSPTGPIQTPETKVCVKAYGAYPQILAPIISPLPPSATLLHNQTPPPQPAQPQPPNVVAPRNNNVQIHEMNIPNDLIGCIIGRGGQKISEIRQVSGANIKIADLEEGNPDRHVSITGTPEQIQLAQFLINASIETFIISNSSTPNSNSSSSISSNNSMMINISQELNTNSIDYKNHQIIIDPSITTNNESITHQLINNSNSYYCPQGTTVQLNDQTIANYITENDIINEHNNKLKCLNKRKQVYFFKPY